MNAIAEFKGELAAISAALLWAVVSVVYGYLGQKIPPMLLNLSKGVVAIALLLLTLFLRDFLLPALDSPAFLPPLSSPFNTLNEFALPLFLLVLSGAIGISFGDTVFFAALNQLGARRTLLIHTLAPPFTALLAILFLREQLTLIAWCGMIITIIGVAWTIAERVSGTKTTTPLLPGVGLGLLAALAQAVGAVLSRAALTQTEIDPLWSTLIRLLAGVSLLLLWMLWKQGRQVLSGLGSQRLLAIVFVTAFFSTYLGIWLQQISLKFAPAGIAQTLSATSPIFVLPLAIALGEFVSIRAILGAVVSLVGIALLFLWR
ncbi:DMT family transporter [Oscillatoria acuminata]|uniref:Putative membrane protein n=1 Tax=Oscillatoria acuminata PCC 6304 TaxID=56110 RepID=K9TCG8_9CYAN|nr:DMT family transporter [Oscillatoria acuminata]AFY80123.1 putative membrane protein [Oscillatoria acuminata PCC 6304]